MVTIGLVSTVRAHIEDLKKFVYYHLNIGCDYIVLFYDDPENAAYNVFVNESKVIEIVCSSNYWSMQNSGRPTSIEERQEINVNNGAAILANRGCDWIIHIDVDELIRPLKDIKKILQKTNFEAIRFTLLEAVPKNINNKIYNTNIFKQFPKKHANIKFKVLNLLCSLGLLNSIFEKEFFRGHTNSKMAIRIQKNIGKYRIHDAKKFDNSNLIVEETKYIELLHFDCVGIENWKLKWDRRLDGSGKATNMRDNRRKQLLLYKKERNSDPDKLRSLYKRLYFIPKHEQLLLYVFGMLKKIKLDEILFSNHQQD